MKKGNKYMNKDGINKVVNPSEFDTYLSQGWVFGNTKCKNYGYTAWNKGLTKETSESVRKISESKTGVSRSNEFKTHMSQIMLGKTLSEETRDKISKSNTGNTHSLDTCNKISQTLKGHTVSIDTIDKIRLKLIGRNVSHETKLKISNSLKGVPKSQSQREKLSVLHKSPEFQEYINNVKRNNRTFNTSTPEEIYYNSLIQIYGEDDVVRQYRDERYPFSCDFYIKSLDKFIELNLHWTHGGHPYNDTCKEDLEQKRMLEDKATYSQYYSNALYVWTDLDVRKQKLAKEHNLNYEVIYHL